MAEKNKKRSLLTFVHIALCILLIPIIIINVSIIISTYVHPNEIPGVFGIKPVAVLSGSMEDTFMTGDLILVKKSDTADIKEGDVICYLISNQAVTHRVVGTKQDTSGNIVYVTKGDANNTEDSEVVQEEQIQGIWTGIRFAGLGNFVMFLSSTTGMLLFIVLPVVLLILWDTIHRWRMDRNEKSRTAELEAELKALKEAKKDEK